MRYRYVTATIILLGFCLPTQAAYVYTRTPSDYYTNGTTTLEFTANSTDLPGNCAQIVGTDWIFNNYVSSPVQAFRSTSTNTITYDLPPKSLWKWVTLIGYQSSDADCNSYVGGDFTIDLEGLTSGSTLIEFSSMPPVSSSGSSTSTTSYIVNSNQDFTNGLFLFFLIFFGLLFYADRWFKKERR